MTMRFTITMVATVLMSSGLIQAQDGDRPGGRGLGGSNPQEMIERLFENDENNDGKLSADEVGERMQRMVIRADINEDGFATKEELIAAFERGPEGLGGPRDEGGFGRGGRGGEGGFGGPGGQVGGMTRLLTMLPIMKALDADGNSELSTKEIENAVAALKSLDKDNDGILTAVEMMPDMSQMRGGVGGQGGAGARLGQDRRPQRPAMDDEDEDNNR